MVLNIIPTVIVIYEVHKDPSKLEEVNLLTIKFLTYYFMFLRTILVLPMVLAFACFASPALYGLDSTTQYTLAMISAIGMLFLFSNAVLGVIFFRDNSPFSKLEFSSSVNFLDEMRLGIKIVLGFYGSMAQKGSVVPLIFTAIYCIALMISIYFMHNKFGLTNYPFNRLY